MLSIAVALFIARSITRPLIAITRASEGIARGDYDQRITVEGNDELARLASSFNTMAQRVAQSNRALRDFLADVSHELRTPLTTVQGFSQAILDGTADSPEAVAKAARVISEDSERMRRMVEDLLHLSQIQSGQLAMEVKVVDLTEVAEDAVKRARQRTDQSSVDFKPIVQPAYVTADARRIGQVLDNLLSNAINHTPRDGKVTVGAGASGDEVSIRVHNPGSFIPPEDRERIFQRFARGRDGKGTGLGLSIAQEIARSHGGRIDLETSPTDGTAFTLVLRRVPPP
jgi:signal transduction histidine kinase